jgi:hypothetical protein
MELSFRGRIDLAKDMKRRPIIERFVDVIDKSVCCPFCAISISISISISILSYPLPHFTSLMAMTKWAANWRYIAGRGT